MGSGLAGAHPTPYLPNLITYDLDLFIVENLLWAMACFIMSEAVSAHWPPLTPGRRHCRQQEKRGSTGKNRVEYGCGGAPLESAGESAFPGPRSPAPAPRGGASGSGQMALKSCAYIGVSTWHHTHARCWCQPSFPPSPRARAHAALTPAAPLRTRHRRQSGTSARSRCRAPCVARQISRTRTYQMPFWNCPTWPTSTQPQSSPTLIL